MNSLIEIIHGKHDRQAPHSHDHGDHDHSHAMPDHGMQFMRFLGLFIQAFAHNGEWISNYRTTRLIPSSNRLIIGTIAVLLVGVVLAHVLPTGLTPVGVVIVILALAHLAVLIIGGLLLTLFIRHQRTTARQAVIGSIRWQGTEQVLDVGCGTGMMLNGCARQLTTGKATGIDLWLEQVSGNQTILMDNARAEGVADKVSYQEMDARHLTFADTSFNVIVSSFALHHIGSQPADRAQAVSEMIRVLKSGGTLSLVDVGSMIDIAEAVIAQAGLTMIKREQNRFFRVVTARKA